MVLVFARAYQGVNLLARIHIALLSELIWCERGAWSHTRRQGALGMLITYVVLTAFAAATATIIFAFVATPQLVDNDDEEAG